MVSIAGTDEDNHEKFMSRSCPLIIFFYRDKVTHTCCPISMIVVLSGSRRCRDLIFLFHFTRAKMGEMSIFMVMMLNSGKIWPSR